MVYKPLAKSSVVVATLFFTVCFAVAGLSREISGIHGPIKIETSGTNTAGAYVERESKSFPVSGVPSVRVKTFDGAITVRGWNQEEVKLLIIKSAHDEREARGITVRAEQQGREILITADFDKSYSREITMNGARVLSNSAQVDIEIYVPRRVNLRALSGDNGMRVEGIEGEVELRTKDGAIVVKDAAGSLRVSTGDGQIEITNFDGEAEAQTGDGPIKLAGRFTQVVARTEDGEISLTLAAGTNAIIETNSNHVFNRDQLAVEEAGDGSSGRVRRWRIGSGGGVFKLHTDEGSVELRSSPATSRRVMR
jgi:Putative adhesin